MSSQFSTTRSNIGDLSIAAGVLVDVTGGTSVIYDISPRTSQSEQPDPTVSATRAAPRFAGGSSRNMLIIEEINANIPSGWHKQTALYGWSAEDGDFTCAVAADGSLEWSDATDVIMTAPAGSIPIADWISCATAVTSGGVGDTELTVDLGAATGLVTLDFNAYNVPDIFTVDWDGAEVINTGYRGDSGTYDGVPVTVSGPGLGTASFTKTTASPSLCTVRVNAPFTGTAWDLTLGCPGGGSPPYTVPGNVRATFVATSTAYGNTLNGATPFTLDVIYEGGASATQIDLTCEPLIDLFDLDFPATEETTTRWSNYSYRVDIDAAGEATISDQSDVIAIRPTVIGDEQYLDPTGSYASTTYGQDTYNNGVGFSGAISMIITAPLELYTYLNVTVSAGSVTGVTGPFSDVTLPANTTGVKTIPISYSDGLGNVEQYFEGSILWK